MIQSLSTTVCVSVALTVVLTVLCPWLPGGQGPPKPMQQQAAMPTQVRSLVTNSVFILVKCERAGVDTKQRLVPLKWMASSGHGNYNGVIDNGQTIVSVTDR